LQGYYNQINQANAQVAQLEQQRQAHQNAANYWNSQIQTWGIVGWQPWWWWQIPIYGWIYNPQAEANRNAHQAAANSLAQQRDAARFQAQQLTASLQPQIAATQQQIAELGQERQGLLQQQQTIEAQFANHQLQLLQLQKQLLTLNEQLEPKQTEVKLRQQYLDGLNDRLQTQQQQRDTLLGELAELNRQKADLEQKIIDKYREIELTDEYLKQVKSEITRLGSRLELLNKAGVLEQQYQDNWQAFQTAMQNQTAATNALLATREAGKADRELLANLQGQLQEVNRDLVEARSLASSLTDTQQSLAFTQLQISNQQLLIQTLIDRDPSLASTQSYYLNLARQAGQQAWYWNGSTYAYNPAKAAESRSYLEQASFIANDRNKLWQQRQQAQTKIGELNQKLGQEQAQIADLQNKLAALGGMPQQFEAQAANLQAAINTVNQRLAPLQAQENKQLQALQTAVNQIQTLQTELVQTTQLQSTALRQLIGLGVLASESDVDFFATQVEPKVKTFIDKLQQRSEEIAKQLASAKALTANWEQQLANTTDEVSKQALTNLIEKSKAQVAKLEELNSQNQQELDELQSLLTQANNALTPLRQQQELEIRRQLESNANRLDALQSQLNSENAADAAIKQQTVLSYAQLNDQVRKDLIDTAANGTKTLLESNPQTKDLGKRQHELSKSVDELVDYITQNFADPYGEYHRSAENLRDEITKLGVVEERADQLDTNVSSTQDAIERIKLRLEQDAKLWEEIAPIAIRYGVESQQLKEYLQLPGDEKERRAAFLAKYPENGTAINLLVAATQQGRNPNEEISNLLNATQADVILNAAMVEGRNPLQALLDKAKAAKAEHEAQGYAQLAQAAWYEQQAAYHWSVSRKNGPYWYEERCYRRKRRRRCETITHVDYNWILWDQYSKLFPQLRAQGTANLIEADKWRKVVERLEPLAKQWTESNEAANTAKPPIEEARNLFAQLAAARESIPGDKAQLDSLETLLPTIQKQLEEAKAEADAQNAKVRAQWDEYDADTDTYQEEIAEVLKRRGELNQKAIQTQQQLAEAERWVERQTVGLATDLESTKVLTTNLEKQRLSIENEIRDLVAQGVTVDGLQDLYTKGAQLDQTLQLLNNKAAILTAQQTTLTQKRTMLTAQNEVILAEQRLLDAYMQDPDADYSNLQAQLQAAREALAEAQRLAEQAEAASKALTAPLQEIQTELLVQNYEHLKQAREHEKLLKELVKATQSNANYALQAAQKQQKVNSLQFQILQRLQEVTIASNRETKHLLKAVEYNDMATAAEIYYRDFADLAGDRGGKSSPGLARPEDRILADKYYQEMMAHRELQRREQAQANAFKAARETAQAQLETLRSQEANATKSLEDINAKLAETDQERKTKEQELAIATARLNGISRIRNQTEQTFVQLVTLEKLNLAQAELEQQIAQARQENIDAAVQARMERDALELDSKRKETTAKIEQLRQLQAEDELRQSINQVRVQQGLATLEPTEDLVQLQTQLAGLLTSLKELETQQPELPADVKAALAEAQGDIHQALQGKETANMQENLLKAMSAMIGQIEQYKKEISRITFEELWDVDILQTAQQDLKGALEQLWKQLQLAGDLQGELSNIEPLYWQALKQVALAQNAVDISQELAEAAKKALDEIIQKRIEERKARQKSFWQKVLGIVSNVIGVLGAILTVIPSPLTPLGIGLTAASVGINVAQAAINGDWLGAQFMKR
jgi:chromosome segregation ATPase